MVEKIERFNQSGVMEGTTAFGAKHFTSMKQDVLDLCESRYDAKVKKCCNEQPLQVSNILLASWSLHIIILLGRILLKSIFCSKA